MLAIGAGLGAILGAFTAWRRKGNILDILQYAFGFGVAFGLVFFIAGLIWLRMG
ncbi:MAG: hypothetical protein AAF754_18325 [Pseudomonadota bacterium]